MQILMETPPEQRLRIWAALSSECHEAIIVFDAEMRIVFVNGIAANRLELEITEGIIVQDTQATTNILHELHDLGVQLSIDDFGMGYSPLSYLRRFPADKLKIDRSFINAISSDASAAGIVRGIIQLAHGLKMKVIAEGVETAKQLALLRDLNCDYVQGFLISHPLPLAELREFFTTCPARGHALVAKDAD